MEEETTIIEQLRHFAPLNYRYQIEDALASLRPHTEATFAGLTEALRDEDPDVRFLATQILDELDSEVEATTDCYEPRLTIEQLVALLREPHPDHDFFEPEVNVGDQQKLELDYSSDAIRHVALCELVEHRAKEAVPDILRLIESPALSEGVRLHATRAVFDITGVERATSRGLLSADLLQPAPID